LKNSELPEAFARPSAEELEVARELVRSARERGTALTGPGGLLKALTKTVIETALDEEMADHLGYDKHDPAGQNSGNSRNGTRTKTVLTDNCGPVEIEVPRDRVGSFDPAIVKKWQRRSGDVDTIVLSLYSKGLTTGEISAHFAEIYGASVSKDTVSRITDKVIAEMAEWSARPLDKVYAAIFIDAIHVKIRDGQVGNRPVYARDRGRPGRPQGRARSVGRGRWRRDREVLDERPGRAEEPWRGRRVLRRLRRAEGAAGLGRGSVPAGGGADVCDPSDSEHIPVRVEEVLGARSPRISSRSTVRPAREAAWAAFEEFEEKWGKPYPAISQLWRNAWEQFTPFLDYDVEIRKVLCSTNAIESLNARYRRAVSVRGHFPTEQAAMKCLYLVTRSLDPKGTGQTRWTMRWKPALNAFAVTFADRMPKAQDG
jgi:putative transposase